MRQLISLNEQDVPCTVRRSSRDNEIVINRRYAADPMHVLRMRATAIVPGCRVRLSIDNKDVLTTEVVGPCIFHDGTCGFDGRAMHRR